MVSEKKEILKPILHSRKGVHLTAYLKKSSDLNKLNSQLHECIIEADEWLYPVMNIEERRRFLEPAYSLLKDPRFFKSMTDNIGLFRTKDSFRILNIPVDIERQCHVADSFHVKPLLKWLQTDREFLILGLKSNVAHLYYGSQTILQKLDTFKYLTAAETSKYKKNREEYFAQLSEWFYQVAGRSHVSLFLAGEESLTDEFCKKIEYKNTVKFPVAEKFSEKDVLEICSTIRKILKSESEYTLDQALFEFRLAEEYNLTKSNIFQISKAAVQGRIKKLIIADGISVFGKIDLKTGGLAIHPFDLNHEDDDILDDLAQTVLAYGGDVVIAPKEEIPKGRPALAILEPTGTEMNLSLERTI